MFSITLKDITRHEPKNLAYLDSKYKKRYLDIDPYGILRHEYLEDLYSVSHYIGGAEEGLIYATIENDGLSKSIYGLSNVPEKSILEITGEYYYETLYRY